MVDGGRGARLRLEPRAEGGVVRQRRRDQFQGNVPVSAMGARVAIP